MDKRFAFFLAGCLAILAANMLLNPPRPAPQPDPNAPGAAEPADGKAAAKPVVPLADDKIKPAQSAVAGKPAPKADDHKPGDNKPGDKEVTPAIEPDVPDRAFTLGSADENDPYRMLVTLTTRGAAVERIELNSPRYHDLEDRSGYLGHLFLEHTVRAPGCVIDVVGPGTPADKAGLKPGDNVKQINTTKITCADDLNFFLAKTKPNRPVALTVAREGKELNLDPVLLGHRPLQVVRPEATDPLSFLLTLYQVDKEKLSGDEKFADDLNHLRELKGAALRTAGWQAAQPDRDHVVFTRKLPLWNLELTKTYAIAPLPDTAQKDLNYRAYHLSLTLGLHNTGDKEHSVAYQLDGPTGLPTEGWWYANIMSGGLRDVVVSFNGKLSTIISQTIADYGQPAVPDDKFTTWGKEQPLGFIGVDSQYFTVAMIPQLADPQDRWFDQSQPLRVGEVENPKYKQKVNVSCRTISIPHVLKPAESFAQEFVIFAGPKKPDLLAQYGLGDVVSYGWFHYVAVPMVNVLHAFNFVFHSYGVAIILLTVLVRLCMFPLSRKQALSTMKMQELQPEIKRLQEKHKGNAEARTKAQQELWRKHNFNPLGGCLTAFIQLPIFVALYRALAVDVELRQAPLLSESIRWCSNLSAPDMLVNWSSFMPEYLAAPLPGMLPLGPYFNILPILTMVLFLWQQKKMMPPPADEQAAMQQKMMKLMMIVMGVMFFKVASGLCIYFIASSLWGIGERKFLPKFVHPDAAAAGPPGNPPRTPPGRDRKKPRR